MADVERQEKIKDLIRKLPEGFVATYGDLCPEAPRLPGRILAMSTGDKTLPWHRVVRTDGSLAQGTKQRRLLRKEGIPFKGQKVDMEVARIPGDHLRDLM